MPDDDDVYFGKNRDEEEEEEDEEAPADTSASKNKKAEKKVDHKGKRVKEAKVSTFKLDDYQEMEDEVENDSPTFMAYDQGGRLDIEDYIENDSTDLFGDDEYDAREVEFAIEAHGSDEGRNLRTVSPSVSLPTDSFRNI
jgi:hypothetical protein